MSLGKEGVPQAMWQVGKAGSAHVQEQELAGVGGETKTHPDWSKGWLWWCRKWLSEVSCAPSLQHNTSPTVPGVLHVHCWCYPPATWPEELPVKGWRKRPPSVLLSPLFFCPLPPLPRKGTQASFVLFPEVCPFLWTPFCCWMWLYSRKGQVWPSSFFCAISGFHSLPGTCTAFVSPPFFPLGRDAALVTQDSWVLALFLRERIPLACSP